MIINGGFGDADHAMAQFALGADGVMLGRAAYHRPRLLAELERAIMNPAWAIPTPSQIVEAVVAYARGQGPGEFRLHAVTRHMHGLMSGLEGARAWRRFLSDIAGRPQAPPEALNSAFPILKLRSAA